MGPQPEHPASPDHSDRENPEISADIDEALAHRDERQIGLDTNRSFVLYPVGDYDHSVSRIGTNEQLLDDGPERECLKKQLYDLIVSVFRKRRHLNYFQVSPIPVLTSAPLIAMFPGLS